MYRVIIVDDDPWSREDIKASFAFEQQGFEVIGEYGDADSGLAAILRTSPDLVVSDIRMGANSGLDMLRRLRENRVSSLFVLVSGYDDFSYVQEAFRYQAFYYLLKPLDDEKPRQLLLRIRGELAQRGAAGDRAHGEDTFGRALQYVDDHLEENFSLEEMANALYLNKHYLSDLFTKKLGQTFTQYKNAQRVDMAAQMIRNGDLRMLDVAERAGFDSASHFCKVFKRVLGVTPYQYKSSSRGTCAACGGKEARG